LLSPWRSSSSASVCARHVDPLLLHRLIHLGLEETMIRRLLLATCIIAVATPTITAEPFNSRKMQIDDNGYRYVLDQSNHRILRFDAKTPDRPQYLELPYLNVTAFVVQNSPALEPAASAAQSVAA
jgi:hypothetical protein